MKCKRVSLLSVSLSMVAALFASVSSQSNNVVKETTAESLPESELYVAPAAVVSPHTYTDSPTNEPWYSDSHRFKSTATDSDGDYYQRNQKTTTFDFMNVTNTWKSYRGENVKVAVIDTGCYTSHEDFNGTNIKTISKNMVSGTTGLSAVNDAHGHGTSSAATIAAAINGKGGTGIAPNVELIVLKCVDSNNAFSNTAINNALQYCIDNGVDVINMSIQGYNVSSNFSTEWFEDFGKYTVKTTSSGIMTPTQFSTKLKACHDAGITLVAAAGNYNTDRKSYPAANDYVIAVGSTGLESATSKAGYSNYGDWLDISAPGYVYTPVLTGTDKYSVTNGTSFSAPLVTGAIALYKSKYPDATPDEIEAALKTSAQPISWQGGAGALDVDNFLATPPDAVHVESLSLSENEKTLNVGDKYQIVPTILPADADQRVTYESYDTDVCTVNENGLVTAVGEGESFIEVTSVENNSCSDTVFITVEKAQVTSAEVTVDLSKGVRGGTPTNIIWTIDGVGTIKQEQGTGSNVVADYISAPRFYQNHLVTFTPTNGNTFTKIQFTCSSDSYATALKNSTWSKGTASSSGSVVTWTGSENSPFALILGAQTRISSIKITYSSGGSTPTTPTVTSVTITGANSGDSLEVGNTLQLGASVTGANSPAQTVTWSSSDNTYATVSTSGLVTAKAKGTVTITATSTVDSSKKGTISLNITKTESSGYTGTYYNTITASSGTNLLGQLHTLMANTHSKYTTYDDCKNPTYIFKTDPGTSTSYVTDFYTQKDNPVAWGSGATGTWNREHVWCQSLSVSASTGTQLWGETYGGSDLQHVRPVESTLNSKRNNNPYGVLSDFGYNRNEKLAYAKNNNSVQTDLGGYVVSKSDTFAGVFEPLDTAKGDVARILMYVYMHYSNQTSGTDSNTKLSGHTTDLSIKKIVNTSANTDKAAWNLLLSWNESDPVSEMEQIRNEEAFNIQGNRNPFIDHPEYAEAIWGSSTPTPTKTLSSISISNEKTEYSVGDTFEKPTVTANYSDGSHADVTNNAIFSGYDLSTAGPQTVSVSYTEGEITQTTTYEMIVNPSETTVVTINRQSITATMNGYKWYEFNANGIKGKAYAYQSNDGIQMNGANNDGKGLFTNTNFGYVKTVKLTRASSTERAVTIYGSNEPFTESNFTSDEVLGSISVSTGGSTLTLDSNYKYIAISSTAGSITLSSIEITYGLTPFDVVSEVTAISLDKQTQNIDLKDSNSFTLTPTVTYTGNPDTSISWVSDNTSVATVSKVTGSKDEQITVTALNVGTATITATCGDEHDSCIVTVSNTTPVVTSVTISPSSLTLTEGETSKLNETIDGFYLPIDKKATWSSENSAVATVDQEGNVTAVSEGTTRISATYGGQTGFCDITVIAKATPGPGPTPTTGYSLVTNASNLAAGDHIIIVGIKNSVYYSLTPYASGNNCKGSLINSPVNNVISSEVADLTLGGSSGAWTLFDGTNYLYASGGTTGNQLKGQENEPGNTGKWTISVDAEGKATIVCNDSSTTKNTVRFNTNGANDPLFACYSSGQTDVYIYKKSSGSVTPDRKVVSVELQPVETSIPFMEDNGTYTVSAKLIATFDDGKQQEVTPDTSNFVIDTSKLGKQTITASYKGFSDSAIVRVTNNNSDIGESQQGTSTEATFKTTYGSKINTWNTSTGIEITSDATGIGDDRGFQWYNKAAKVTVKGYTNVKEVELTVSANCAISSVEVSVGGVVLGEKSSVANGDKNVVLTFTNVNTSASAASANEILDGDIVISVSKGDKSFYLKSIDVTTSEITAGETHDATALQQVKAWSQYFLDLTTPICSVNPNDDHSTGLSGVWGDLTEEFELMDESAQALFLTSTDDTISEAYARYTHIVSHYGTSLTANFAGAQIASRNTFNLFGDLQVFTSDHPESYITVILGLVGAVSIGGYFMGKKRKEN